MAEPRKGERGTGRKIMEERWGERKIGRNRDRNEEGEKSGVVELEKGRETDRSCMLMRYHFDGRSLVYLLCVPFDPSCCNLTPNLTPSLGWVGTKLLCFALVTDNYTLE